MGADHLESLGLDGGDERPLHVVLGGPATLVGREAQIAIRDELNLPLLELGMLGRLRKNYLGHTRLSMCRTDVRGCWDCGIRVV